MIFKGTIELSVSEQNQGLIPLLVQFNGGNGDTKEDAVDVLKNKIENIIKEEMILRHLDTYFGIAGQAQVEAVKEMLENPERMLFGSKDPYQVLLGL